MKTIGSITTHSTGLAISQHFIITGNCSPVNSGVMPLIGVTTLMGEIFDLEKLTDGEKTELLKIYRLWARHREKSFPDSCRGETIKGIDLDTLRQNFFGCVSSFLTRGVLTDEQKEYLYACDDGLGIVTLELQG